ncbi:40S ribosomal protein S11 [Lemmus lemmus]
MKMQRTIVICRDYLHYIRKYNRFEKRHKNMSVHLSPFQGCTDWRHCHRGRVQAPEQDSAFQCAQGH